MEDKLLYLQLGGFALFAISVLWMVIAAFTKSFKWGLAVLLLFPITAWIFAVRHWKRGLWPMLTALVAVGMVVAPLVISRATPIDWGPLEENLNGKLKITLSEWKNDDYSVLLQKPDVAVLVMNNPDVTDDTLKYLKGMEKLERLNLSKTKITNDGLKYLAGLQKLERLEISDTRITDEGLKHLTGLSKLKQLELDRTDFTDKGLEILSSMESLKLLSARETNTTKDGRKAFRKAGKGRIVQYKK